MLRIQSKLILFQFNFKQQTQNKRGCIPPLWGSGLYRSIQFSAFEATYKYVLIIFFQFFKNIVTNCICFQLHVSGQSNRQDCHTRHVWYRV